MTEEYGIPVWGSYIMFAVFTIVMGLLFGLVSKRFPWENLFPPNNNNNNNIYSIIVLH
jgi:hypothetical protein